MTRSNQPGLKARLHSLLEERKTLRSYFPKLRWYLDSRSFNKDREKLEAQIAYLITNGVGLSRIDLPADRYLAEAAYYMAAAFLNPTVLENPAMVWDKSLTPGVQTNYHPVLKARLMALCGPLDSVLAEMLA